MEEVDTVAEYVLVVLFDSEALPCVHSSEASLQLCENLFLR
jgi:hypothetical protein